MKIMNLDGKFISWTPRGAATSDTRAKSSLHEKVRELLKTKYPTMNFIEEVSIPIRWNSNLYLDFYCPVKHTAYEVHGEQHYKLIPHFHSNLHGFIKQRKRDAEKEKWCEINGINLIVLPYHIPEKWEELI